MRARVAALHRLGGAVLLAALGIVGGCTQAPPERDPVVCADLFEQYDRLERTGQTTRYNAASDSYILAPRLERQNGMLIRAGCLTRSRDLDGMEALGGSLAPYTITQGGAAIRPVPVHVGGGDGFHR